MTRSGRREASRRRGDVLTAMLETGSITRAPETAVQTRIAIAERSTKIKEPFSSNCVLL
jgi:hypothetical protein